MLHRFSILTILASWLLVWSSATVHVHHGHDCNHQLAESVLHVHSGDGHCHSHGGFVHNHSTTSESTDENGKKELPSVSGDCPLCELTAMELSAASFVEVAPPAVVVASVSSLQVARPLVAARYSLRGRAPPAC